MQVCKEDAFCHSGSLGFSLPSDSQPWALSCLLSLPFCMESTGADYESRVEAYYLRIGLACGRSWAPPLFKKGIRMKLWILLGSLCNKVKFCTEDRGSRTGEGKEKGLEQTAQQLRIHATLAEDTGSLHYTRQLKTSFKSSSMGFNILLWPPKTSTSTWCIYTHSDIHIHIKFLKNK